MIFLIVQLLCWSLFCAFRDWCLLLFHKSRVLLLKQLVEASYFKDKCLMCSVHWTDPCNSFFKWNLIRMKTWLSSDASWLDVNYIVTVASIPPWGIVKEENIFFCPWVVWMLCINYTQSAGLENVQIMAWNIVYNYKCDIFNNYISLILLFKLGIWCHFLIWNCFIVLGWMLSWNWYLFLLKCNF